MNNITTYNYLQSPYLALISKQLISSGNYKLQIINLLLDYDSNGFTFSILKCKDNCNIIVQNCYDLISIVLYHYQFRVFSTQTEKFSIKNFQIILKGKI